MRVLINVNEQITETMLEKYFQASGLEAEVLAVPKDKIRKTLRVCRIDLFAFYAERAEDADLLSFIKSIGDVRKILFIKKQNLVLLSEELEGMLDECFSIPLDCGDLMIRLRRMYKTVEPEPSQFVQNATVDIDTETRPVFEQSEYLEQQQAVPSAPQTGSVPAEDCPYIEPINTEHLYSAESFWQQTIHDIIPITEPPIERIKMSEDEATKAEVPVINTSTDTKKNRKNKSPLRYLNKSELFEIILEQEKTLAELNSELARAREEIDERAIILEESGSIAEAVLKLNGIFEAAQKTADEYLESIKRNNILVYPYQEESVGERFENQ